MDVLNFISWIKAGNYRAVLPAETTNLLAVGAQDPSRDDGYLSLAVNAAPLQSLYNTGTVTQTGTIVSSVTIDTLNGVITTVSSSLGAASKTSFTVNNSQVLATSKVIVSLEYDEAALGFPIVTVADVTAGSFKVVIVNAAAAAALNNVMKVHYIIIA